MSAEPQGSVATTAAQQARRDRIVHAAIALLDDRPYERIQVKDVAESAQVALGTLYRYFPSKEQLFAEALLAWSETFPAAGVDPRATTDAERLTRVLRRTVTAFERHPNFFGLISALERVPDPAVVTPFRAYSARFESTLVASLPHLDPADAAVVAHMSSALLGALLRRWSVGEIGLRTVRDELDRAVAIAFGALHRNR